jgi:hypothetical protein
MGRHATFELDTVQAITKNDVIAYGAKIDIARYPVAAAPSKD